MTNKDIEDKILDLEVPNKTEPGKVITARLDDLLSLFSQLENEARQSIADEIGKMQEIQGVNGTWNFDPYMHGMYNGMEFCHALVKGVEPKYREAPKQWLADVQMKRSDRIATLNKDTKNA